MSTPSQNKRKLLNDSPLRTSPFARLAQRTDATDDQTMKDAKIIRLDKIQTNPRQPRRTFDQDSLTELANDIEARGVLQPIIVRPIDDNLYEIVVGERRYQAAKQAGLETIPAIIHELSDEDAQITSLVENIQRENLTITDEANYFKMLETTYGYSIREIADTIAHKSKSYVDARLNLAENPEVLKLVQAKKMSLQAAVLLMHDKPNLEANMQIIKSKLAGVLLKDTSLDNSQSVLLKDTSQSNNDKKPRNVVERPKLVVQTQPFLNMSRTLKAATRRLEHEENVEKEAILECINQLQQEIAEFKDRLEGY